MVGIANWRRWSLKTRVLVLMLATMIAIAIPAAAAFHWIVTGTVVKLGTLFAEKQILFDRYRGLEALMREVSLAETVARAPVILEWAQDENEPEKARRGLAELEHYRLSFNDRSYFVVLDKTGNYYFNDKDNNYEHTRLRYTVSRENPQDAWYFKTRTLGSGCHLNVNRDDNLGVTKVWINCLIQKNGEVLGIIGTGVDLTQFIREVVEFPQTGVQSMFVDLQGAVQAHRDPRLVDFRSLTKDSAAKQTIFRLLDREGDRAALAEMMKQVARGDSLVQSRFMTMAGREMLVGVGFLDRLGWFNVTLMDVDVIIDRRLFAPIGALMAAMLIAAAALLAYLFKRKVLNRLAKVEQAVTKVRAGAFDIVETDLGQDEIGRLSRTFSDMARAVGHNAGRLEAMVAERTQKLERLAGLDPLTGILNRRGFEDAFQKAQATAASRNAPLGLLLVDLDQFKPVNDQFGHQAGDAVIHEAVARMQAAIGPCDICARWGGDEFILLIVGSGPAALPRIAGRLVTTIGQAPVVLEDDREIAVTASVGGCAVAAGEALSAATLRADEALYAAKKAGRNGFIVVEEPIRPARLSA
jgi:diguanylate cyclase (GGDEF)-like protein